MYYWKEKYENIWDSAPRIKSRGVTGRGGNVASGQCVCHDKALMKELDKLLEAFSSITTDDVSSVARHFLKEDLCCCQKNYCKHTDTTITDTELDSDLWDLYTFFLNEFNTKDQVHETTGNDDSPGGSSGEAEHCDDKKDDDDKDDDGLAMFDLFADKVEPPRLPHLEPLFKVKIMETMRDCMTHRDIHRFYLLQHIKLTLHFFDFQHAMKGKGDNVTTDSAMLPPDD